MTIQLDGSKPLWGNLKDYVAWVKKHSDEIHDRYMAGDENAEMIVGASCVLSDMPPETITPTWRAAYAVIVERYISEHHPEIARITKS